MRATIAGSTAAALLFNATLLSTVLAEPSSSGPIVQFSTGEGDEIDSNSVVPPLAQTSNGATALTAAADPSPTPTHATTPFPTSGPRPQPSLPTSLPPVFPTATPAPEEGSGSSGGGAPAMIAAGIIGGMLGAGAANSGSGSSGCQSGGGGGGCQNNCKNEQCFNPQNSGKETFSDQTEQRKDEPPADATKPENKKDEQEKEEEEKPKQVGKVNIISEPWCAPCQSLKNTLTKNGVEFTTQTSAQAGYSGSVPYTTVTVNGSVSTFSGYSPQAITNAAFGK